MKAGPCSQAENDFDVASVAWSSADRDVKLLEGIEPLQNLERHREWADKIRDARARRLTAALVLEEKADAVRDCLAAHAAEDT